jgi:uncharacterized ACR, COG1430|uniref:Uncharacterized protein n=1 Tax=Podoviridae sp. ctz6O13 TaxID=2827757 RepID=A0A8S5TK15_9CAUD|nr:MAG TPA: hypothetical protein [Podoviridae sp. ctz6O13]
MNKILVTINDKVYRCELANTEEDRRKGLMGREYLAPDEGMLFDFSTYEGTPEMYMKDTNLPLDMIGIDDEDEVIKVHTPEVNSDELIPFPDCKYVLEVNAGSGIEVGADFEMEDDVDLGKYSMKILAPDGTAQGLLQGGERIFSRVSTKRLITRAKKAFSHKDDKELYEKDCKKLGTYVFKELYAQDHRDPQYVSVPDKD